MALTLVDSGASTSLTGSGTEDTIDTVSTDNTYIFTVDLTNFVAGDRVEINIYVKINSSGSERLLINDVIWGDDVASGLLTPLYVSVPIPVTETASFKMKQTDGTARSVDWQTLSL